MRIYYLIKRIKDGMYATGVDSFYPHTRWGESNDAEYFKSDEEALSFAKQHVDDYFTIEKVYYSQQ